MPSSFVPSDDPFVPLRTTKNGFYLLWLADIALHGDKVTYLYEVLGTDNTHQHASLTVAIDMFQALAALGLLTPETMAKCVHTADGWCIVGIIYTNRDRNR